MTSASEQREFFGLLEMGSNSLKLYLVPRSSDPEGSIETIKLPWRVAHDSFGRGSLSAEAADEVVARMREARRRAEERPLLGILAIATGVFRELPEMDALAQRIEREAGVPPRVIGGDDEASLMARGFRELDIAPPAVMCDLGGASLEWAFRPLHGPARSGSLPLGAIRNRYRFQDLENAPPERYLAESAAHCDALLAALPVSAGAQVVATGGTAEALAFVIGHERVSAGEIADTIARVQREGPPASLKAGRKPVFLPGLVILSRVVARCGALGLTYGTSAVRLGMVRRLVQLLEKFPPSTLHATQLLHGTQIKPR